MIKLSKKQSLSNSSEENYLLEVHETFGRGSSKTHYFELDGRNVQDQLFQLREQIDLALGIGKIKEAFACSNDQAYEISKKHSECGTCNTCTLKFKECLSCVFEYPDPVENHLFLTLGEKGIPITGPKFLEMKNKINKEHQESELCNPYCKFRYSGCYDCVFTCQSPLERQLYKEIADIPGLKLQQAIDRTGALVERTDSNKYYILTIPDFLVIRNSKKVAIYADGHTYHERTEDQAKHDRNIDRQLQNFGFEVLRYTGKEIRSNVKRVKDEIDRATWA